MPLVTLHRLALLVSEKDPRRKYLENLDMLAQGAVDATRTYMNKHGDESVVETPDWNAALKAQVAAAAVLLDAPALEATVSPSITRIMAALPKATGTSG